MLVQQCLGFVRPILDTTIRMEQQVRSRLSAFEGLSQCCSGKVRAQVLAQSPADDASGEQVQHDRQEHVFLAQLDVGDIAAPVLVRCGRFVGIQPVIWQSLQVIPPFCHAAIDARDTGFHAPFPHQSCHPVLTHNQTITAQSLIDPGTAIAALAIVVDAADFQQQLGILRGSLAGLPVCPGIVTRP